MDAMHANGVFSPNTITVLDNNSFVCVFSVCVFFFLAFQILSKGGVQAVFRVLMKS